MLDIEKIEAGHLMLMPEPIALDGLLRESLRLNQGFADRFMVKLALAGEVPEVTVRGDRKRLMQVMTNLLICAPPLARQALRALLGDPIRQAGVPTGNRS